MRISDSSSDVCSSDLFGAPSYGYGPYPATDANGNVILDPNGDPVILPGAADIGVPAGWFPVGYTTDTLAVQNNYHPFYDEQTIIPETSLITAYAEGSYELCDDIEEFGKFLFNRRQTYPNGLRQFWHFGYTGDL